MVACPGHILESTKGIEIKLGTYIDVNERKCRRQEPYSYLTFYLSYLSLILFIKGGFLCHLLVYNWCLITGFASGIWWAFLASSEFLVWIVQSFIISYFQMCWLNILPNLFNFFSPSQVMGNIFLNHLGKRCSYAILLKQLSNKKEITMFNTIKTWLLHIKFCLAPCGKKSIVKILW